jgi:plastocyanin
MSARLSLVLVSVLAACGDDGGTTTPMDAPPVTTTVSQVNPCPATVDATVITTGANMYMPMMTTITQGQVVKFTMNAAHDVAPLNAQSEAALAVPLGAERCFRFTAAKTHTFKCTPHGFTGTIVVN